MNLSFLSSGRFWLTAILTLSVISIFFAWELNALASLGIAGPPRPAPTQFEILMTMLIAFFLPFNVGLFLWRRGLGACPRNTGAATGTAGFMGVLALICPVCTLGPLTFIGFTFSLAVLAPFAPLLQLIAVLLLAASLLLLLPKKS